MAERTTETGARPRELDALDLQRTRVSVPLYLLIILVSAALGTVSSTGVVTQLLPANPQTQKEVDQLKDELDLLHQKMDDIVSILEQTAAPQPRPRPQPVEPPEP